MKYVEKHYGEGDGNGKRIMNPGTEVYLEENSYMEMEMVQIKGVDSTNPEHEGRAFSRCEAGYPGETDDTRRSGGGERICGEFKR